MCPSLPIEKFHLEDAQETDSRKHSVARLAFTGERIGQKMGCDIIGKRSLGEAPPTWRMLGSGLGIWYI
jgi:hypothetical protein